MAWAIPREPSGNHSSNLVFLSFGKKWPMEQLAGARVFRMTASGCFLELA